eukprot:TRINITY_DN35721_c0_g1_i1.p1 TRINITY_DN35721_c0_g1~~TRINITY_DN35721_c0_g1_i1.p1  ORF type:complete len:119 (-),score=23.48 TRINITY_DN35721_c0_g1_i1:139-495(-)
MSVTAAAEKSLYAARRAAQKEKVRWLYRQSLKHALSWCIHRHLFWEQASNMRDEFEANRNVEDIERIDKLIADAQARLRRWGHPEPYICPTAPGGTKFGRNAPIPEVEIVFDYGIEKD